MWGGAGDDVIRASWSDDDIIDCGPGNDTVYWRPGRTKIKNCENTKRMF